MDSTSERKILREEIVAQAEFTHADLIKYKTVRRWDHNFLYFTTSDVTTRKDYRKIKSLRLSEWKQICPEPGVQLEVRADALSLPFNYLTEWNDKRQHFSCLLILPPDVTGKQWLDNTLGKKKSL